MYIEFEKITFRNFLSYGNALTEIILNKDNFSLITGFNGCGKSSLIVDSISWCLFGKLHRQGITQKQVINNINKKACEIALYFTINNKKYCIKRGLKPNYLELWMGGKKMDSLSSTTLVQKEIDALLQMSAITFKNISVLSVNTSKPFVEMTPQETRSIIEDLLGLKIYSLMLDNVKKRIKDTKDMLKNTIKDFEFTKEIVIDGKEKLKKYKELKEKFEKDKQDAIDALEKELKILEKEKESREKDKVSAIMITEIEARLEGFETAYDKSKEESTKLDLSASTHERDISGKEKEISFFEDNSTCPTCASEMDDKHRQGHIKTYKKEIADLKKKIKVDGKKQDKVSGEIETIRENVSILKDEITELQDTKKDVENDIRNSDRDIARTKKDIETKKDDTIDNHISGLIDKQKIKDYVEKYKKLRDEKESFEAKLKLLTSLKTILSDEGVKASAIKKDLPFLNTSIKKYMSDFEKNFHVEFSDTFDITLKGFSKKGLNYYNLSAGEKKRIDLAILLSFIDMTRNKNSVHTNILVLDELLDGSIDSIAQGIFVSILKEKIKKEQLKNIFVVSHNKDLVIEDATRIECYKEGDFSRIKVED